ncbi:hypothetical protein Q4503_16435 [Colwellia sp. 6_MG-2023]|uniref:hypothetical protein n=1 Tax=Colwellia sp. 6_MG-2023 TaxID=3062676 RepID=UPI0026E3AB37|nr:hypothetical protein [Colwellia sp. 6_MG-2023]MDO6489284.1 hypothetical protein [Colwellia sp. 6_MG-2023]
MANFSSFNFKKNGAQHLKDNGKLLALAIDVVKADTYAQASAKVIASAAMTSGDVALTEDNDDLKITVNGKSIDPSSTAAANNDLVVLVLDDVNEEVIICNDATDRVITNEDGDTVTIPAIVTFMRELAAVA